MRVHAHLWCVWSPRALTHYTHAPWQFLGTATAFAIVQHRLDTNHGTLLDRTTMANVIMHVLSVDVDTRLQHAAATHATVVQAVRAAFPELTPYPGALFAAARAVLDVVDHVRHLHLSLFGPPGKGTTRRSSSTEEEEDATIDEAAAKGNRLPVHPRKLPSFGSAGRLTTAAVAWHTCVTRGIDLHAELLDGESVCTTVDCCVVCCTRTCWTCDVSLHPTQACLPGSVFRPGVLWV